jgi:DNA repair photolyase
MHTSHVTVKSILTRSSGYLRDVCSHSLQPYRGCPFGSSLCGVGCYVQHSIHITQGRPWGSFLEVRTNASEVYLASHGRERSWARGHRGSFVIFLSSATEPFPPQEDRFGVTGALLEAMIDAPPDGLIVQTHSPRVARVRELLVQLSRVANVRCHLSIESDLDRLPGLPPPPATVEARLSSAAQLKAAGLFVVITVSPLLPIADPERFFHAIAEVADAVVLDHYVGGDGSPTGSRTLKTALPGAMAALDPDSVHLRYRDRIGEIAERHLPGRVGYHSAGFAGRWGK